MSVNSKYASALVVALVSGLTACGGGGSGTTATTPAPTTPTVPTTSALALGLNDTFAGVLQGSGTGLWSGDIGADGGSADGGGAAGDGEFVKVSMKFPSSASANGTLTWTVLRSQFGIANSTGTLNIQRDATGVGGYKVVGVNGVATAVRATQGNFFVSTSGQLTGTLPLAVGTGGAVKDTLFNGIRFNDARSTATDMSEFAGQYGFASLTANVTTGAAPSVSGGILNLNANGSGRICDGFVYSATCANGLDVLATFDDPTSRNLIRIVNAATQSQSISAGAANGVNGLFVPRKFGTSGVSMTGDVVLTGVGIPNRTGAVYASRVGSAAINPSSLVGAWSITARNILSNSSTSNLAAVNFVGGVLKANSRATATTCDALSSTLTPGPINPAVTITGGGSTAPRYLVQLDADLVVFVAPGEELGLLRRYSSNPLVAPCQPS